MAKRKEVILQEILNTQESWEEAMSKEKLYVVDAHQKWCGPCVAIVGMLKRIKNELGDDLLKFATAEVDSISNLERYRGKCEPNFLFFASGNLVASVRGCNAPLIQSTIENSLTTEHKVLKGEAERKVISDSAFDAVEAESEAEEEEIEETVVPKKFTIAVIKPDVVSNGQVDEIIAKIEETGIEILTSEERMLTEDDARELYQHKADEEYFADLITYVTSGPCRVLVLTRGETGEGVLELWREIIGPFDAAVAKDEQPNSLRSIYGENATRNALHGSTSEEEAVRELGFFFPNFNLPTCTFKRAVSSMSRRTPSATQSVKRVERTLAIIRPDALAKYRDSIMEKINEAGFKIAMQKEVTLTREQAEDFYSEHKNEEYFDPLVKQMTRGPVLALCLAANDAVARWRTMLGPKVVADALEDDPESLRAVYCNDEESDINLIHGSDSPETAEAELSTFFNVEQAFAVIKPDAVPEKEKIMAKLEEAGFMISCQKDLSLSKEIAAEIYKSKKGAEFYDDLVNHMTSGNTLTLVLSADNAVQKLRTLMGPVDPDLAKEEQPDSIRAMFAKSKIENAIHASSSHTEAKEDIKLVFGDVGFEWDGTTRSDLALDNGGAEEEVKVEEEKDDEVVDTVEEDRVQVETLEVIDKKVKEEDEREDRADDKSDDGSRSGDDGSSHGDADDEGDDDEDDKKSSDDKNDEEPVGKDEEDPSRDTEEPAIDKVEKSEDDKKFEENDDAIEDDKQDEDEKTNLDDTVVVENKPTDNDDKNDTASVPNDDGSSHGNDSPDGRDAAHEDSDDNDDKKISSPTDPDEKPEPKQEEVSDQADKVNEDANQDDNKSSSSSSSDSDSDQEKKKDEN